MGGASIATIFPMHEGKGFVWDPVHAQRKNRKLLETFWAT